VHKYTMSRYVWLYHVIVELLEQAKPSNLDEARQVGLESLQGIVVMCEGSGSFQE